MKNQFPQKLLNKNLKNQKIHKKREKNIKVKIYNQTKYFYPPTLNRNKNWIIQL